MGVERVEELVAYQFASEFKLEVYRLIDQSVGARRDFKFKAQLQDAASGMEATIVEGFGRRHAAEFAVFLRYALASLAEARASAPRTSRSPDFAVRRPHRDFRSPRTPEVSPDFVT